MEKHICLHISLTSCMFSALPLGWFNNKRKYKLTGQVGDTRERFPADRHGCFLFFPRRHNYTGFFLELSRTQVNGVRRGPGKLTKHRWPGYKSLGAKTASAMNSSRLKTQAEPVFQLKAKGRETPEVPAQPARQEDVPLPHWSTSFIVLFWPSTDRIRPLT